MITGAGVVDDDGDEALAKPAEHQEYVVECGAVICCVQVVRVVEFWAIYPAIEQAGKAGPVGGWCWCDEGEAFCGLLFNW